MPARLQIKAEDCSPLGRFILQYLEEQGISMNRLADLSGVPQPRLRGACFKGTCPTPETLRKLAKVIGNHHLELYTLAYEGRIEPVPEDAADNSLDQLMRELFETAREMDLIAPKVRPSKAKIRRALLELGFQPEGEAAHRAQNKEVRS
jgi:transcriptional regulator with XRE-family HTH domain